MTNRIQAKAVQVGGPAPGGITPGGITPGVAETRGTLRGAAYGMSHGVLALALGFGAATTPALAQEAPRDPAKLKAVRVQGEVVEDSYKREAASSPKLTQPLVDTPKTITVIPREVIEARGATSLTEVLRTVPGISLGAGEGGIAAGDRTFIRGYDARGDTFVDGARDFGAYFRDPFNLEAVEVIKGPGSAISGRGSTGGALNQVSKAPRLDNFIEGAAVVGSDETLRGTLDINQVVADGVAVRLNAMGHDQDVAGRDAVYARRWGVAPSVAFGLNGKTQVVLSWFHQEQDNLPDYGLPFDRAATPTRLTPVDVDADNFYGLVDRDFDKATADIGTVRVNHEFSDTLSLRNQTRYGRTTRNYVVTKPEYNSATSADTVVRSLRGRDSEDTILINQLDLTAKFATGGITHTVVTGLELSRETSENRARLVAVSTPAADLVNPDPDDGFTASGDHSGARTRGEINTVAVYAFDTMEITDKLQLSGGLRWDHADADYDSVSTAQVLSTFDRLDKYVSWQAGVLYKPAPNGSIYVSLGSSRNPSAEYFTLSASTDDTKPEKTKSYEIGTKWDLFDEALSLTAALFRTDKTNARVTDPLGGDNQLIGGNRADGFEVGVAGNITAGWSVFGGYTYVDSKIRKTAAADVATIGNQMPNVAKHSFSLWSTYQVTEALGLGGGATYQSKRYAGNDNTYYIPGYWRFDATASYAINQNLGLRLNLQNLTDKRYFDSTHAGQHALVAPGRTALLTLSAKY